MNDSQKNITSRVVNCYKASSLKQFFLYLSREMGRILGQGAQKSLLLGKSSRHVGVTIGLGSAVRVSFFFTRHAS